MSEIERRFCWRCLLLALAPFLLLAAVAWFAITRAEAGRASVALEVDALLEELADLESANAGLRTELGATREDLRAARAAAAVGGEGGVDEMVARIQALPEAERAALFSSAAPHDDPDQLAARVSALPGRDRARFFDTLPSLPSFTEWFDDLDQDAQGAWLRQLPGGGVLFDATITLPEFGAMDADAIAERLDLLRDQAEKAAAERDDAEAKLAAAESSLEAARAERDRLREELDSATAPRAAILLDRLARLEPAEKSVFFGALPRNDLFGAWFSSATVEEQEAFAAALPAAMKRTLSGVEAPGEGWLTTEAILRRFEQLRAERDAAAEQTAKVSAPGRGPLTPAEAGELIEQLDRDLENAAEAADRAAAVKRRSLQSDLDAALAEVSRLRAELEAKSGDGAQVDADALESLREQLEEELAEAEAKAAGLEEDLQTARASLEEKDDEIAALKKKVRDTAADDAINNSIVERIRGRIDNPSVGGAPADVGRRTALQLSSSVAFETASATLSDAGRQALDNIAAELKAELAIRPDRSWRLMIKGHTDSRPINTEQFPSNWTLSSARAASVARYLAEQGVPPERLYAIGRAEFEPVDRSETAEAYAKNRRIEFEIVGD